MCRIVHTVIKGLRLTKSVAKKWGGIGRPQKNGAVHDLIKV